MIFTTTIRKDDDDFRHQHEEVDGGARLYGDDNDTIDARVRKAAIKVARDRAVASFNGAELCNIRVVTFHEWGARDRSVAEVTLDIQTLGDVHEVTA